MWRWNRSLCKNKHLKTQKFQKNLKKIYFKKVAKTKHCYLEDNEEREEGGTPAIIESIRLGLVFQLKEALDEDKVRKREQFLVK